MYPLKYFVRYIEVKGSAIQLEMWPLIGKVVSFDQPPYAFWNWGKDFDEWASVHRTM